MCKSLTALGGGLIVSFALVSPSLGAAQPDLFVWAGDANPVVELVNFEPDSCEVLEGCAVAGTRKLLRFEMQVRNVGTTDLYFGDISNNPLFHYDACHGHYHFEDYARYNLLDGQGIIVAQGGKIGFCLQDSTRWDFSAPDNARYDCSNQGIQAGWADIYSADLPCQWIDVTAVAPGDYTLQIIVDPSNLIPEFNDDNNSSLIPVHISDTCDPPANDSFATARFLYESNFPQSLAGNNACATKETGETNHVDDAGGHSVWFRWVPASTMDITINTAGSNFDTLLAVYAFTDGLAVVAANDDIVTGSVIVSEVAFRALAGTEYRIVVDGYGGAFGDYKLNLRPPTNDFFGKAATLSGARGSVTGWTIGASFEPSEPSHAASLGLFSVWYVWQAPFSGTFTVDTIGSDFDTTLALYTGTNIWGLALVASDNNSGPLGASRLQFSAAKDTEYRIAISGPGNAAGHLALNWAGTSTQVTAQHLTNGLLEITVTGSENEYLLEASANLRQWSPVTNLVARQGMATYQEPAGLPLRFYRVRLP